MTTSYHTDIATGAIANASTFNAPLGELDAAIVDILNGCTITGSITLAEMVAPDAPAANKLVLYAVDNGAGKTQLMVRFPSGVAQQIAIEA